MYDFNVSFREVAISARYNVRCKVQTTWRSRLKKCRQIETILRVILYVCLHSLSQTSMWDLYFLLPGHCRYHSEPAHFEMGDKPTSIKPVGIYPCCEQTAIKFDPTQSNQVFLSNYTSFDEKNRICSLTVIIIFFIWCMMCSCISFVQTLPLYP